MSVLFLYGFRRNVFPRSTGIYIYGGYTRNCLASTLYSPYWQEMLWKSFELVVLLPILVIRMEILRGRINHVQILQVFSITNGLVHGDLAPWNLKWAANIVLLAVEWEFAEVGGPIGPDLVHYLFRIHWITRSADYSSKSFKFGIIDRMKKFKPGLYPTNEAFLKQLFLYYLVWHQIILEENGIYNSPKLNYYRVTSEVLNGSL